MNAFDGPPDDLQQHADQVVASTQQLIWAAWAQGVRDGLEFAAQLNQHVVDTSDAELLIAFAETMRDQIRLQALQVETPEVTK